MIAALQHPRLHSPRQETLLPSTAAAREALFSQQQCQQRKCTGQSPRLAYREGLLYHPLPVQLTRCIYYVIVADLFCHTVIAVRSSKVIDAGLCLTTKLRASEGGNLLPWSVVARRGMPPHVLRHCRAAGQKHHAHPAQVVLGTPPAGRVIKPSLSNA